MSPTRGRSVVKFTGTQIAVGVLAVLVFAQWAILHTQISSDILNESSSSAFPDTIRTKAVYAEGFHIESEDGTGTGSFHISPDNIPSLFLSGIKDGAMTEIITLSINEEDGIELRIWDLSGPSIEAIVTSKSSTIGLKIDAYKGLKDNHATMTANEKFAGLLTENKIGGHFFPRQVVRK